MDHTKGRNIQELESVLHAAAGNLSLAHVAVLVEHPEAVRSALAVVADVLSSGRVSTFLGAGSDIEMIGDGEPQRVNARGIGQTDVKPTTTGRKGRTAHLPRVGGAGRAQDPPSPSMTGGKGGGSSAGRALNGGTSSRRVSLIGAVGRWTDLSGSFLTSATATRLGSG